jgi:hypothetical protein
VQVDIHESELNRVDPFSGVKAEGEFAEECADWPQKHGAMYLGSRLLSYSKRYGRFGALICLDDREEIASEDRNQAEIFKLHHTLQHWFSCSEKSPVFWEYLARLGIEFPFLDALRHLLAGEFILEKEGWLICQADLLAFAIVLSVIRACWIA